MVTRWIACLCLCLGLAGLSHAQKTYENTEFGFSFKPPSKDWSAIPTPPGEDVEGSG